MGCASHHGAGSSPGGSADTAACVPPAGYVGTLKSPFSRPSLSCRSSTAMVFQALGPFPPGFLQGSKIWGSSCVFRVSPRGCSCLRTEQDVLFASFLPSKSVIYLTSDEGRLFCTAHFWAAWRRRAHVLIHVGLCKQRAKGSVSAGANCSCRVIRGVLWICTRLGIPAPCPQSWKCFSHCVQSEPELLQILNLAL